MNVEVTIDEPEIDIELEEEEQEKTVCARLVLTKKQVYLLLMLHLCTYIFNLD